MTRSLTVSLVASAWILTVASSVGRAAPIVAGDTTFFGQAIQDVTIYGGTVFNPGPQLTLDGFSGVGSFTIDRQAESGNSIAFTGVDAIYTGSYPGLGSYTFAQAGPSAWAASPARSTTSPKTRATPGTPRATRPASRAASTRPTSPRSTSSSPTARSWRPGAAP